MQESRSRSPGFQAHGCPGVQETRSPGARSPGVQESRSPGVQESRSRGVQGSRTPGRPGDQEHRSPGPQESRIPGIQEGHTMHAGHHLEHYFHHDLGNISGQKSSNFQMSECHLEHRLRPPECPLSDSECTSNILGENIFEPKIIISDRNIFHHVGCFPCLVLEI